MTISRYTRLTCPYFRVGALNPELEETKEVDYPSQYSGANFERGKVRELEAAGHYPSANLRGYKADAWDGGHRVPFLVRWPSQVEPGSQCDELVSLVDLMATCADLNDSALPAEAGGDSVSLLPLLQGSDKPVREAVVHHSGHGKFAIREGKWKLMLCPGSGGWTSPRDFEAIEQGLPAVQLYDMESDIGERRNLQAEHPEVVQRLTGRLEEYIANGRSTPGLKLSNDVPIDILKEQA
jgi:arylsulfatase A